MRYAKTHKQETRERLIQSTRAIAKRDGFGGTGVDALMSAIGLTGGAFYSHFGSKAELFAELVEREMTHSARMLAGEPAAAPDNLARCLRAYLSMEHVAHPETGCVLPALGSEIGRTDARIRRSVERSLQKLEAAWREQLGEHGDAAWALIAQCVGALVIARATDSERVRRQILSSSRRIVEATLPEHAGRAATASRKRRRRSRSPATSAVRR
ncbi:MAG TPA: TetR/AcrR family transcriptional regulator [Kofleriaceae bacterium]|nr:TetR/AcrR family transcriptional regulator [Kofleriaceae bacterium]